MTRHLCAITFGFGLAACGAIPKSEKNMSIAQFEQVKQKCYIRDASLEPMQVSNKVTIYWPGVVLPENAGRLACLNAALSKLPIVYGIQIR